MFEKIDHLNLTVSNISDTVKWYRDIFDFSIVEQGVEKNGDPYVIIAKNDFMICAYENREMDSANSKSRETKHKIYHYGIRINDRNKWQQIILEKGIIVLYEGPIEYKNSISWYIEDPSGHQIEVSYAYRGHLF